MNVRGPVLRGARWAAARWWAAARPSAGADLRSDAVARDPEEVGRPPTPEERLRPSTVPTGPWAEIDPHVAGPWPSRAQLVAVVAWGGLVGAYGRRVWRGVRTDA